ncbi:MAG: serine hydrolase [Bacteroidales bacterium]|nr:serine hydrolase [Bacteroidales bacterium]
MKTIFLTIALVISSMATFAQIGNPRSFFEQQDESQLHNEIQKPPNIVFESKSSNTSLKQTSSFDPIWAQQFQNALDSIMQLTGGKGASIAIYTPEEGLWTGVSGISHDDVPITTDMRFGIGSNSKLFIAVTLLKLQEQGILSLDDPLYQWIPPTQYVDSTITIRQLLNHQSGIFDFWNDQTSFFYQIWDDTSRVWTTDEILSSIGSANFTKGTGVRYSNTNFVLGGMIIEAATGQSWVQTVHDFIIDPLGLNNTFVGAFEPRNGPVAAEWDYFFGNLIIDSPMTSEYTQANACGALLSTASDMVLWYNALFTGMVLSESSMQQLLAFEPSSLMGLGIFLGGRTRPSYYHTGGMLGYASIITYDPLINSTIGMLFNDRSSDFNLKISMIMSVFMNDYTKKANDAGIVEIRSPWNHYCTDTITPIVTLKNFGTDPLTNVTLKYGVEGQPINSYIWAGSLVSGGSKQVTLPSFITQGGTHKFVCFTELPNGQAEGYHFNDSTYSYFYVNTPGAALSGLYEDFSDNEFPKKGWTMNSISIQQWNRTSLTGYQGTGSAVKNNYDIWGVFGKHYDLMLPLLNLTNSTNPNLSFDYAFTTYPGAVTDSLRVSVSQDCGATWETLFYKGGIELRTAPTSFQPFYPQSEQEWAHVTIPLTDYQGDILIQFRERYGQGNNLFLDNILVGSPVGQTEISSTQGLSLHIYPNPTSGKIGISANDGYMLSEQQEVQIELFDLYGKLIERYTIQTADFRNNRTNLDLSKLPSGTYLIHMKTQTQSAVKKIVKM